MARSSPRTVTHKEFFQAAQAGEVRYAYPGIFQAGAAQVKVPFQQVPRFLEKLRDHLPFEAYDRLTRAVWVEHMRCAEDHGPFARRCRTSGDEEPGQGRGR